MTIRSGQTLWFAPLALATMVSMAAAARPEPPPGDDLTILSLEDLLDIEITSVAKKEQRLSDAAAAIYVITGEDVRRSGVTTIPEALRMAPGVQVARIDANKWAITARGFNGRFAGKMLVLVDGRSVYSPLFAGVYWDAQDTLLEDLDRIEVIRGPGATLWGANAVNGVINIITKSASETQGQFLTVLAGDEEQGAVALRHGGRIGENGHYKVYGKYFDRDASVLSSGEDAADDWDGARLGFRADWALSQGDSVALVVDAYDLTEGESITTPLLVAPYSQTREDDADASGASVSTRWDRAGDSRIRTTVQFYADHSEREDISFSETRDTVDLEFQQRFDASTSQELVWGAGYRYTSDDMEETFEIAFDPGERGVSLFSAFIQDEISLGDGRARITLGSKFEHNDYTGLEVQPNVRAVWKLGADNRLWAAISRAVRSPSRIFHDVSAAQLAFPDPMGGGATLLARVEGNSDYESEDLLAFELGYRVRPTDSVYVDVAAFFNDYSDVTTIEQAGAPFLVMTPIPHVVVPMEFANEAEAESFGFEITANWRASPRVNFFGSYGYLDLELDLPPASAATFDTPEESPEHQAHLRGAFDLNGGVSLDVALFYVDELEVGVPGQALGGGTIPNDDYVRLDVRLGWQPRESFEAFLVLQNLQDEQHPEFGGDLVVPTEFERSIHGGIRWSF